MNELRLTPSRSRRQVQTLAWLLVIVGLTALSGWLVFGIAGVVIALGLAFLGSSVGTRVSGPLVLRMQGGKPIEPYQAPELYRIVVELSQRAGLPRVPAVFLIPSPVPQAMSTGSMNAPALGITRGLLATLGPRELTGVLAHEISHLRGGDLMLLGFVQSMRRVTGTGAFVGLVAALANMLAMLFGPPIVPNTVTLVLVTLPTAAMLATLAMSRVREYSADLGAAHLTGDPEGLARALLLLEHSVRRGAFMTLRPPEALTSHPATARRVAQLRALVQRSPRYGVPRAARGAGFHRVGVPSSSLRPPAFFAR